MGTPTQYYVDPSIAGNSGAGTVGDPYGDLQWALDQVGTSPGRDATNGDQFNVKSGTDEILAAILDFSTYGTPTQSAPCIIRGYASAANDGDFEAGTGIGGIDGNNGDFSISNAAHVHYVHMHLHNTGTALIVGSSFALCAIQCELDTSTGGLTATNTSTTILGCHIHDISGNPIAARVFIGNFVDNTQTIKLSGNIHDGVFATARCERNIFVVDSSFSAHVITIQDDFARYANNSILATGAATGTGISFDVNREQIEIQNNLIEGFSGSGGKGIDGLSQSEGYLVFTNNGVADCETDYPNPADVTFESDNESLGSSPFAKSGALTFGNRFIYFAPLDIGNVHGGSFPVGSRVDKGAVQHADPAGGGGGTKLVGFGGGMIG